MSTDQKTLTITYYVDPRHLRSFTITVRRANILLGIAAFFGIWSVVTLVYLGAKSVAFFTATPTKLASTPSLPVTEASTATTNALDVNMPVAPSNAADLSTPAPTTQQNTANPAGAVVEKLEDSSAETKTPAAEKIMTVKVAKTSYDSEGRAFVATVHLENTREEATIGRVWAIAQIKMKDGTYQSVAAPSAEASETLVDKDYAALYGANSVLFRAKKLTVKDLRFSSEPAASGVKPESIKIFVKLEDGTNLSESFNTL